MLESSPLHNKISTACYSLPVKHFVSSKKRNKPSRLADSTYPKSPLIFLTILNLASEKESYFVLIQECRSNYMERAFWILQSNFHINEPPSLFWQLGHMHTIFKCYAVLHNIMVEHYRPFGNLHNTYEDHVCLNEQKQKCFAQRLQSSLEAVPLRRIASLAAATDKNTTPWNIFI